MHTHIQPKSDVIVNLSLISNLKRAKFVDQFIARVIQRLSISLLLGSFNDINKRNKRV